MPCPRIRQALAAVVLTAVGALVASSPTLAAPPKALHQVGRWLVDGQGRVVILHGVNQVNKLPPYLPSAIGFGADDAAAIAAAGFNTVRTGLAHQGLAAAPGVYDAAYLDDLAATVDALTAQGIYVLLDFHQDLYGARYQGNGMADWATVDSSPTDPALLPACDNGFPGNIFACPFLWEAFDRFLGMNGWTPEIGPRAMTLQEEFADAWRQVAARFRDEPLVFGYNLLNEPYPGSATWACLSPVGCPAAPEAALTAFSNLVADAIREVDPDTIVFYEPFAISFNPGFGTKHGDVDVDQVGFSFHVYACIPTPSAPSPESCRTTERQVFTKAEAQAAAYGHAPLLTEFGATDDLGMLHRITELADAALMGWQYWAWWNRDPCCEAAEDGIIDDPANPPTSAHLDEAKLDALVRPYPRAVAGTPTRWSWDRTARRFALAYATAPVDGALAPGALTEVWIPARHFPNGYDVVDLRGGVVTSAADAERLEVAVASGASSVSFAVVPAGCDAVPPAGCRQQVVPGRGSLDLGDAATDAKARLAWSWVDGAATSRADFGDPAAGTGYRVCAWDETGGAPRLVLSAGVAAGGICDGKPCWRATDAGFRYKDRNASVEGVRQLVVKAGAAGRARIQLRAQGARLALPALPFAQDPRLVVQLRRADTGACWESRYGAPAVRNDGARFKDRAE
ncbi:MAG: cellulase family glycosylhydrolase [Deltaproteobacteria bacterium]|nr:cellulase family glycosylhydrolase [Deltaproteobacteria bacterium]